MIYITLVVMTGDGCLLFKGNNIPQEPLNNRNSKEVVRELLRKYTRLEDREWALIRQVGFIDGDMNTFPIVLYAVELPEKTGLYDEEVRWESISFIDRITDKKTRDMIRNCFSLSCNYTRILR